MSDEVIEIDEDGHVHVPRDERIDQLLALFTCPQCKQIRMRGHNYNGIDMCMLCYEHANRGDYGRGYVPPWRVRKAAGPGDLARETDVGEMPGKRGEEE